MRVILTAKDSTVSTLNKTLYIERLDSDFFNQLNKEVIALPKTARKLLKILTVTNSMLILPLVTSGTALASPENPVPQELKDSLLIIMSVIATLGVATAIITLMIAGGWKMLFGKNRADQWTTDILRGLTQVIAAPVLVAIVVGVFTLLFSNVPAFQPMINPITIFFRR
ncbi:hypothetical protein PCURB6_28350 [Paenibacillus curdlanolyticus]|nr:hypothetical protein PCURB6_28350 [Paenibacillus curdlanolyticus]